MSRFGVLDFVTRHPLNRDHKLRALWRFAKWQLASRMIGGAVAFEWINGARFLVRTGETGMTGNIYAGLQEFADMGFLLHFLRPEDEFVDVGANVGSYTILAGAVIGAAGWAFEPVPATFGRLLDNVRLNGLESRVKCLNVGVGRVPGRIRFTQDFDTVNHALAEGEASANSLAVETSTLDLLLGGARPALIKIDVEGYETPVLEGAKNILENARLKSVIMELNGSGGRYGHDEAGILRTMSGFGFKTYSYDPLRRKLMDLGGRSLHEGNTLFLRSEDEIMARIASAPKFNIQGKSV